MIIINEKYKLEPTGSGSYDVIEVKQPTEKSKSKEPYNTSIAYGMTLDHAINKVIHISAGEKAKDEKGISLFEYVKILKATTVKINQIVNEQIKSNE